MLVTNFDQSIEKHFIINQSLNSNNLSIYTYIILKLMFYHDFIFLFTNGIC